MINYQLPINEDFELKSLIEEKIEPLFNLNKNIKENN